MINSSCNVTLARRVDFLRAHISTDGLSHLVLHLENVWAHNLACPQVDSQPFQKFWVVKYLVSPTYVHNKY